MRWVLLVIAIVIAVSVALSIRDTGESPSDPVALLPARDPETAVPATVVRPDPMVEQSSTAWPRWMERRFERNHYDDADIQRMVRIAEELATFPDRGHWQVEGDRASLAEPLIQYQVLEDFLDSVRPYAEAGDVAAMGLLIDLLEECAYDETDEAAQAAELLDAAEHSQEALETVEEHRIWCSRSDPSAHTEERARWLAEAAAQGDPRARLLMTIPERQEDWDAVATREAVLYGIEHGAYRAWSIAAAVAAALAGEPFRVGRGGQVYADIDREERFAWRLAFCGGRTRPMGDPAIDCLLPDLIDRGPTYVESLLPRAREIADAVAAKDWETLGLMEPTSDP